LTEGAASHHSVRKPPQHPPTHPHPTSYIADAAGNNALPGIMALGYIGAFSETLALAVIAEKVPGGAANLLDQRL
jgi:hypothetical protein